MAEPESAPVPAETDTRDTPHGPDGSAAPAAVSAAPSGKHRKRRRKPRPRPPLAPPPERSARLYVRVPPAQTALFRYLLEAHDNLALFTVVDRLAAVLELRFGPEQEPEVRAFLREAAEELPVRLLPIPPR